MEGHVEYLNELMDWWEHAGLGELDYDSDPFFHIIVRLAHPAISDSKEALPLWELDDGIIEGALLARYPEDGNVRIRREEIEDSGEPAWRYTLIFIDDELDEESEGVVITDVESDSGAQQKGLQPGTLVVEVNQEKVSSPAEIIAKIDDAHKSGRQSVLLLIDQGGDLRFVALKIKKDS